VEGGGMICVNVKPLGWNKIAPPLELNKEYYMIKYFVCSCGETHLDVGVTSECNYVSCYKCGEVLPDSDKIHWCHASRFQ